jgi:glycogen debranching enzyme
VALGHVDKAIEDFRSQLHFVLDDGRIPEQINWRVKNTTRLDRMKTRLLYSKLEYNDLTQIPVLPYSLRAIYNATGDVGLLQEFLPGIVRYFHWWRATRDLDGTGVVTILHPWESGLDLTPAYDAALGLPPESRARPSWRDLYPSLVKLILLYKHWYGWDQGAILASKPPFTHRLAAFKVQDVAVNSVYAAGWGILGDLASVYDADLAKECYEQQRDSEHGILTTLWDENEQHFVTGYKSSDDDSQKYHSVRTIQTLFPLLLSSIPASRVDRIVQMLTNESEFWLPASVPSVSKAEKEYNPIWDTDLLWRGPTWGFPNWFIMEGLQKQGRLDVLDALMDKWIWTVKTAGVWEMYNPETGVGYGAEGLGMSTLIVDWMRRLGRI